jgi:hypothetical protein
MILVKEIPGDADAPFAWVSPAQRKKLTTMKRMVTEGINQ